MTRSRVRGRRRPTSTCSFRQGGKGWRRIRTRAAARWTEGPAEPGALRVGVASCHRRVVSVLCARVPCGGVGVRPSAMRRAQEEPTEACGCEEEESVETESSECVGRSCPRVRERGGCALVNEQSGSTAVRKRRVRSASSLALRQPSRPYCSWCLGSHALTAG